eukprot:403351933
MEKRTNNQGQNNRGSGQRGQGGRGNRGRGQQNIKVQDQRSEFDYYYDEEYESYSNRGNQQREPQRAQVHKDQRQKQDHIKRSEQPPQTIPQRQYTQVNSSNQGYNQRPPRALNESNTLNQSQYHERSMNETAQSIRQPQDYLNLTSTTTGGRSNVQRQKDSNVNYIPHQHQPNQESSYRNRPNYQEDRKSSNANQNRTQNQVNQSMQEPYNHNQSRHNQSQNQSQQQNVNRNKKDNKEEKKQWRNRNNQQDNNARQNDSHPAQSQRQNDQSTASNQSYIRRELAQNQGNVYHINRDNQHQFDFGDQDRHNQAQRNMMNNLPSQNRQHIEKELIESEDPYEEYKQYQKLKEKFERKLLNQTANQYDENNNNMTQASILNDVPNQRNTQMNVIAQQYNDDGDDHISEENKIEYQTPLPNKDRIDASYAINQRHAQKDRIDDQDPYLQQPLPEESKIQVQQNNSIYDYRDDFPHAQDGLIQQQNQRQDLLDDDSDDLSSILNQMPGLEFSNEFEFEQSISINQDSRQIQPIIQPSSSQNQMQQLIQNPQQNQRRNQGQREEAKNVNNRGRGSQNNRGGRGNNQNVRNNRNSSRNPNQQANDAQSQSSRQQRRNANRNNQNQRPPQNPNSQSNNQYQIHQEQNQNRNNINQQNNQVEEQKDFSQINNYFEEELLRIQGLNRPRYFDNRELETLANSQSSDQLVLALVEFSNNLTRSINETSFNFRRFSYFIQILLILTRESQGSNHLEEFKIKVLTQFLDSRFFKDIKSDFLPKVFENVNSDQFFTERLNDFIDLVEVCLYFLKKFTTRSTNICVLDIKMYAKNYKTTYERSFPNFNRLFSYLLGQAKQLKETFKQIHEEEIKRQAERDEIQRERDRLISQQRLNRQRGADEEDYKRMPPDDFRDISVIPTQKELISQQMPFIRAIPAQGVFRDTHDYLDLIFRLLREDAIRPLREGIGLLRSDRIRNMNARDFKKIIRDSGIRLYETVFVHSINITRMHHEPLLTIRIKENRSQEWRSSKQLLPGSLLVISSDNFLTMNFCIVQDRDTDRMAQTSRSQKYVDIQVQIVFEQNPFQQILLNRNEINRNFGLINENSALIFFAKQKNIQFKMVESTAYFEAYSHVLRKLKEMDDWQTIPMAKYLLGQEKQNIAYPKIIHDIFRTSASQASFERCVLQTITNAKFDISQQRAYKRLLYKEMALVQGPPGTGKTYVGQNFVETLIKNKSSWRNKNGPILLVCYTNHALDQFLGFIKNYTTNFIRMGGRCKDESLAQFSMREYIHFKKISYHSSYRGILKQCDAYRSLFNKIKLQVQFQDLQKMQQQQTNQRYQSLLKKLLQNFDKELFEALKRNIIRENDQSFEYRLMDKIHDKIMKQVEENKVQLILIWLEVLNMKNLVKDEDREWRRKIDEAEDNWDEDGFFNEDDLQQRELDYQEGDEDAADQNQRKEQDQMQENLLSVNQLYKIENQGQFYKNCTSLSDCMQLGEKQKERPPNVDLNGNQTNLFRLNIEERWRLQNSLIQQRQNLDLNTIDRVAQSYKDAYQRKKELESLTYVQAINMADIVAMTTTGCAKNNDILRHVNFSIVIVEEAAEVFEAHILTALSRKTQHLVLIGDHQQLRPSPAVYELEKKYNLNMSMFERLVKGQFDYTMLSSQRRMRPEISGMIKFLYPDLTDGANVHLYPDIRGTKQNVFFMNHQRLEDKDEGMMSKLNKYEAQMIIKFTFYLIQQGYQSKNISILSLYMAQSNYIKKQIIQQYGANRLHEINKVKVVTVDNFQGEESDIIILSLVRSNTENQIGYLKVSNRVCVALSRAKQGLFIFGNATCLYKYQEQLQRRQQVQLDEQSQLWRLVLEYLERNQFIGDKLQLECSQHQFVTEIKNPEDFQNVPEGGCSRICDAGLVCGHTCEKICHPFRPNDKDPSGHKIDRCTKICIREHDCGHPCTYKCYQCVISQQPCQATITVSCLAFNHQSEIICHTKNRFKCLQQCEKIKACGHQCQKSCHIDCALLPCTHQVPKTLSCGHTVSLECWRPPEQFEATDKFGCYIACGELLDCGHTCQRACGQCKKQSFHQECKEIKEQVLQCGHLNANECGLQTNICNIICEIFCSHSKCNKKCSEICDPCQAQCERSCDHHQCSRTCGETCDVPRCNLRCQKLIESCNHQCIGLCGEKCPKICRVCEPDHEIFQRLYGGENNEDALFVEIDCGHIIEFKFLDIWIDESGEEGFVKFQRCPKCPISIKQCMRYKDKINQTIRDMNSSKAILNKNLQNQIDQKSIIYNTFKQIFEDFNNQKPLTPRGIAVHPVVIHILNEWQSQIYKKCYYKSKDIEKDQLNETQLRNCIYKLDLMQLLVIFANKIIEYEDEKESIRLFATGDAIYFIKLKKYIDKLKDLKSQRAFPKIMNSYGNYLFELVWDGKVLSPQADQSQQIIQTIKKKKFIISEEERNEFIRIAKTYDESFEPLMEKEEIIRSLNLSKSKFFKCHKGHVYAVGDIDELQCQECETLINNINQLEEEKMLFEDQVENGISSPQIPNIEAVGSHHEEFIREEVDQIDLIINDEDENYQ